MIPIMVFWGPPFENHWGHRCSRSMSNLTAERNMRRNLFTKMNCLITPVKMRASYFQPPCFLLCTALFLLFKFIGWGNGFMKLFLNFMSLIKTIDTLSRKAHLHIAYNFRRLLTPPPPAHPLTLRSISKKHMP